MGRKKHSLGPALIICKTLAKILGHEHCHCLYHNCTCKSGWNTVLSFISNIELGTIALCAAVVTLVFILREMRTAQERRRRYAQSVWIIYTAMLLTGVPSLIVSYLLITGRSVIVDPQAMPTAATAAAAPIVPAVSPSSAMWTPATMTTLATRMLPTLMTLLKSAQSAGAGALAPQFSLADYEQLRSLLWELRYPSEGSVDKGHQQPEVVTHRGATPSPVTLGRNVDNLAAGSTREYGIPLAIKDSHHGFNLQATGNPSSPDEPTVTLFMYEKDEPMLKTTLNSLLTPYGLSVAVVSTAFFLAILTPRYLCNVLEKSRRVFQDTTYVLQQAASTHIPRCSNIVSQQCMEISTDDQESTSQRRPSISSFTSSSSSTVPVIRKLNGSLNSTETTSSDSSYGSQTGGIRYLRIPRTQNFAIEEAKDATNENGIKVKQKSEEDSSDKVS